MSVASKLRLPGLPLLGKELVEQAAKGRTYVIRVVYAVLLFLGFTLFFYELTTRRTYDPLSILGVGRELFLLMVGVQFAGIYIFLPGMMSGAITHEKERRSLELLFLTGLSPWQILLQKLAGRLMPMLTFLLLSMPLMAIAYAFGGVNEAAVTTSVYALIVTCLQVGTFALMVSAFMRTSAQAFVGSYLLLAAFYFGLPLALLILGGVSGMRSYSIERTAQTMVELAIPAVTWGEVVDRSGSVESMVARSMPALISTVVFLVLGRVWLVRRAFVQPRNMIVNLFKVIDGVMTRMNKLVGNIMIVKDRSSTCTDESPVAWREVNKRALGKTHYLFRFLVVLEVPIVLIGLIALVNQANGYSGGGNEALAAMVFIVWIIAALALTVSATNIITSERTNQTLEVLLTTPLVGRDLLRQKMRGVRRMFVVLLVPFLTLFAMEAFWEGSAYSYYGRRSDLGWAPYLIVSIAMVFIYLPMLSWGAMWLGLKMKSRSRAIIVSLGALVAWCAFPVVLGGVIALMSRNDPDEGAWVLMVISPATMVTLVEFADEGALKDVCGSVAAPLIFSLMIHGGALLGLKASCLVFADEHLGRIPTPEGDTAVQRLRQRA